MKMKYLLTAICLTVVLQCAVVAQSPWKASDYKPEPYRKVMVLAKISDMSARQQLEDRTVKLLNDKGIAAMAAYSSIKPSRATSREAFLAIADSLRVDALVVYSVNGAEKQVQQTATLSVGVGVGMYGGFAGTSVPIAGGAKMVTFVKLTVDFFNRASKDEQWSMQLGGSLADGTDKLAYTLAKTTVKAMIKDKLFVLK